MMPDRQPETQNGFGVLMLLGLMAGVVVGLLFGEPSAGAAAGFTLGVVAALLLWLRDR